MEKQREFLTAWLKDAYAQEKAIEASLHKHMEDAEDYPQLHGIYQEHYQITKSQAERLQQLLKNIFNEETSTLKTTIGNVAGAIKEVPMSVSQDRIVKDILNDYSIEHMEIASYKSLIAAAEELGENEIVRVCQEILTEEEEMSRLLDEQIGVITKEFLNKIG